jgi:hypothetical protein
LAEDIRTAFRQGDKIFAGRRFGVDSGRAKPAGRSGFYWKGKSLLAVRRILLTKEKSASILAEAAVEIKNKKSFRSKFYKYV